MKLPEKTQKELEKKGKRKSPPLPGGGAAGRLHQFEVERGLNESDPGEAAGADETVEERDEKGRSSDQRR